eukprot:12429084-Karenia_brevis.AAC.1
MAILLPLPLPGLIILFISYLMSSHINHQGTIIAGDLNADTADIPTLQNALDNDSFVDLGASSCFNTDVNIPTCYPPNHITPRRRDF